MSHRLATELEHVRTHYASRSLDADGVTWTYLSGGNGDETLLLLPGGPGRAETSFQYIVAFANRYRILAPDYPRAARTVAGLVDGLLAILRAEQVEVVHVVGGSYSGLIAQCLVQRPSAPVGAVILSDTGLPRPERARRHRLYRSIVALMPTPLLRILLRLGTSLYVREVDADQGFWRAYLLGLARSLSRTEIVSRLDAWIDFDCNYSFASEHMKQDRPVLIIEADHDPLFRPAERAALRALYPSATTYQCVGGGHAASLARTDEYIAAIERFLARHTTVAGRNM